MTPAQQSNPDRLLLGAVIALAVIGILMVYSASFVVAHNEFGDDRYFLMRQLLWIGVGGLAMMAAAVMDYRRWQAASLVLLLLSVAALVAVLSTNFGISIYGAQRWLQLGPLPAFQPSELAKLALVVYLATWLARKGDRVRGLAYGSIPFVLLVGLVAGLVMLQPDLGTTVVLVMIAVSIFFVAGANLLHFVPGMVGGVVALYMAITSAGYRTERLRVFLNPWEAPPDSGWHTIQTLIALGSGGLTGLGLGMSRQKAYWVPNAHTDTIFAIIGEELGLVGSATVLALFAIIAWRGIRIAWLAPDTFGRLLATGLTSAIVWQALVNIAVVTNTVPYTGVPLPFISSGGSSLVISLTAVGILLSISRYTGTAPATETANERPGQLQGLRRTSQSPRPQPAMAMLEANAGVSARRSARRAGAGRG